jgi:hypothetical protein
MRIVVLQLFETMDFRHVTGVREREFVRVGWHQLGLVEDENPP